MKKLNFSDVLFNTATQNGRETALVATLSSIMANIKGARFLVQFTDGDSLGNRNQAITYLDWIASASGNIVEFEAVKSSVPIIHTKKNKAVKDRMDALGSIGYYVNLDDDLIVPYQAVLHLRSMMDDVHDVITLGTVDCSNSRNYSDWDLNEYLDYQVVEHAKGLGKAKHHFVRRDEIVLRYQWISQLYALSSKVWSDAEIWDPILEKFQTKGIRGADIMLESLLRKKYEIIFCAGVESLHFGMETPYYSNQWSSLDEAAADRVNIMEQHTHTGDVK